MVGTFLKDLQEKPWKTVTGETKKVKLFFTADRKARLSRAGISEGTNLSYPCDKCETVLSDKNSISEGMVSHPRTMESLNQCHNNFTVKHQRNRNKLKESDCKNVEHQPLFDAIDMEETIVGTVHTSSGCISSDHQHFYDGLHGYDWAIAAESLVNSELRDVITKNGNPKGEDQDLRRFCFPRFPC
jgi:hypothetical protein